MLFRLIVLSPPTAGRQITIEKAPMVIGSAPECAIRIQDEEIFARHAIVEDREDGLYIRDIGSTGTILVNHREVKESRLKHGDEIEVGRTRFLLQARVRAEVDASAPLVEPVRRRRPIRLLLTLFVVLAVCTAAFYYWAVQPSPPLSAPAMPHSLPIAPALTAPIAPPVSEPIIAPPATAFTNPAPTASATPDRTPLLDPTVTNAPPPPGADIQKMQEDINGIRQMVQTLVQTQSTNRKPPAPTPKSPTPVATGWIRISSVDGTKFPKTDAYREMRTFAITLLQTASADLKDRPVRVDVTFFDKDTATGRIIPSTALAPRGPLEIKGNWAPGQQKTITATYTLPPDDGKTPEVLEFHGYVIRVSCAGVLQDQKAKPPDLLPLVRSTAAKGRD